MNRLLGLAGICCGAVLAAADEPRPLAIRNVSLIDVTGAPTQAEQSVVIRGERIVAVGTSRDVTLPEGALIVDGTGKFLIPGLWDMHVHLLWEPGTQLLPLCVAKGVTGLRDLHSTLPPDSLRALRERIAGGASIGPRLAAAGPILDGPEPVWSGSIAVKSPEEGREAVRRLKREGWEMIKVYERLSRESYLAIIEESKIQGLPVVGHVPQALSPPEVAEAGQRCIEHLSQVIEYCSVSEGTAMSPPASDPEPAFTDFVRKALDAAFSGKYEREHFTNGANEFLGSPEGRRWQQRHAARGAMRAFVLYKVESRGEDRNYLFCAEFPDGKQFFRIERTAAGKLRFVPDRLLHDEKRAAELNALFKKHETWQCPTLAVRVRAYRSADEMMKDPRLELISPEVRRRAGWSFVVPDYPPERHERFRQLLSAVGAMQREGIGLLAGTDAMTPYVLPGFSLHDELRLLVRAGLTPMAALQAATLNPARFLNRTNDLGTIEAGKLADLILLDANPLEDISNTTAIAAVVANGRLFDRPALDRIVKDTADLAKASGDTPAAAQ